MSSDPLAAGADTALDRLGLGSGDRFLIVSNPSEATVARALADAAGRRSLEVTLAEFPETTRDGEEPPAAIADAMRVAPVIAIVTRRSLSHTRARVDASARGARIASLPGVDAGIFARLLPIDYAQLEAVGRELAARLTGAATCRVTAPGGTDITLRIAGRAAICDDGDLTAAGAFGNLPAGEVYIAPLEREANGRIVFDGSLANFGMLDEPLAIEVEHGVAASASGGAAAAWLLETLDAGGPNGRVLAELGIGMNPAALVSGAIIEDEKAEQTVHFAFGTNTSMGGSNQASVHIDGLVRAAIVELSA
jgi:leucyl aminopeptidase (aminopeptidase T)